MMIPRGELPLLKGEGKEEMWGLCEEILGREGGLVLGCKGNEEKERGKEEEREGGREDGRERVRERSLFALWLKRRYSSFTAGMSRQWDHGVAGYKPKKEKTRSIIKCYPLT